MQTSTITFMHTGQVGNINTNQNSREQYVPCDTKDKPKQKGENICRQNLKQKEKHCLAYTKHI